MGESLINIESFKYKLINQDGTHFYLKNVKSAKISYDSDSILKQSAHVQIILNSTEMLSKKSKLQIIHVLNGIETPVGTFLMSTPTCAYEGSGKRYDITCYSLLWLLSVNRVENRYLVEKGTQVVNHIRRIMDLLGYTINIEDSILSTSIDIEFPIGTSYLAIINELLKVINYTSLYVDGAGTYTAKKYINYADRTVDIRYASGKDNVKLLKGYTVQNDTFNMPNVVIAYVNNPNVLLRAVFENKNPQDDSSILNSPVNKHIVEVRDCSDVATLYDVAKRTWVQIKSKNNRVKFYTPINPAHLFETCIEFEDTSYYGKLIEKSWSYTCKAGEKMEHICEEVGV